ncbi:putative multidrug resistance ABC transporter ATP-binding/permease protein YheI [Geobacter sp. OR-1]|uniref:ABC transporter ATP-binding protein n=1 Tax=Geobacter sp. OR-1 TaxID=1266765 RepID=UPI0005435DBD|nr:ABC transporter ATP-binding protein [Geobacter sp. OR-1]GAM10284.1 putative multidrug resistance ABC transporter ATP-binding/permease protein YheI [Geobacter sp. OR-1]
MSNFRLVTSYIRQHWFIFLSGIIMVALASLLMAVIPRILGDITNQLQRGTLSMAEMARYIKIICGVGLLRVLTGWGGRLLIHQRGRTLTYTLRRRLFEKWNSLSPAYFHRHSVGDLVAHALSDVEVVRELVSMGICQAFSGLAVLAGVVYLMAMHVDWRLSLAGLGPILAIPLLVKWLGPKIKKQSQRSQEALGSMSQIVEEVIDGIRAVKAFGTEQVVIGRFTGNVDNIVTEKMRFVRLSSLFSSLVPLMVNLGFVFVLGYGGVLVTLHLVTLGDFVAFTLYIAMLRQPMEQLGNVLNIVQRASASIKRVETLLNVESDVVDRPGVLVDQPLQGELRVQGLNFTYPGTDRQVLEDISFSLRPGQTLGIIGSTGSGKSTLADLLLRLYEPPEGTVAIGGHDILSYPLARLRDGIAYVPQDGFLFSTSVLENICFSDDYPDRERAEQCARITAVYENILNFPEGFDTEIGERGVRLSGGQKQRVAIARMIYKDAPYQILDDSLSAIDTTTERQILHNLRNMTKAASGSGNCTIIISHRLSAVQHADEILVLDQGRIIERGSHRQLIAMCGVYAGQWYMQAGMDLTQGAGIDEDLLGPVAESEKNIDEEMEQLEAGATEDAA